MCGIDEKWHQAKLHSIETAGLKFVLRFINKRIGILMVLSQLSMTAATLVAVGSEPTDKNCPHHKSNRECSLAMCPMKHSEHSRQPTGNSAAQFVCSSDDQPVGILLNVFSEDRINIEMIPFFAITGEWIEAPTVFLDHVLPSLEHPPRS